MAITANNLSSNADNANASVRTIASISPGANRLVLLAFVAAHGVGADNTGTVTGCDLTWQLLANLAHSTTRRFQVFRTMGASPTPGDITIDFAGDSQSSFTWTLVEFDGVDTSGTDGSGAIVQTNTGSGTSETSGSVTLAAFSGASNATVGLIGLSANNAITEGGAFTELGEGLSTEGNRVQSQWVASNQTTVDWTFAAATWRAWAAELKIATASRYAHRQILAGVG